MAISPDEPIVAEDFINESEADPTPANNEGKVPKLEANGKVHSSFLSGAGVLYGESSAADDDYEITVDGITAYEDGQMFGVLADVSNEGVATLNVNSIGAVAIEKRDGVGLTNGDIVAGMVFLCVYSGTTFKLASPGPSSSGQSGTGSNLTSFLPIELEHNLGCIPRRWEIMLLGSGGNASININMSGSIVSRVGDNDVSVGGIMTVGTDEDNAHLVSTTVDDTYVTLSLNSTLGSPGTIAYTYAIKVWQY